MKKEYKASTIDEAVSNAMIDLGLTSDKLMYNVIQQGTPGFLGIGSKPFIIEAFSKDDKEEVYKNKKESEKKLKQDETNLYEFKSKENILKETKKLTRDPEQIIKKIKEFLNPNFDEMKINVEFSYETQIDLNTIIINISGEKAGLLIGKHGQTLNSLQHLTNIVVNNGENDKVHIRMDIENYRDKKYQALETLAKNVALKVLKTKKSYSFEPMSPYERRIIHSILQKEKNIETVSQGMENKRYVVVKYKRY